MRTKHFFATAGLSATLLVQAAQAQITPGLGFEVSGDVDLQSYCGTFPAAYSFLDGSVLVFDGRNVSLRSSDGTVIRDYGTFPFSAFPSFLEVDESTNTAYFGESSPGRIRSLDLDSGAISDLTTLMFNYDMAFDVVPGQAYVVASAFGSATNSLFRVDLLTGQEVLVARIDGFSGPVEVDELGNVYVGVLPGSFPYPNDSVKVVRFDADQVTSGAVLTDEVDGFDFSVGYDGMSSADYDPVTGSLIVVETNTGSSGSESVTWRLDRDGDRVEEILRTPAYASEAQSIDSGSGTAFAGFQPPNTSVRVQFSECFGNGDFGIYNVVPKRPTAVFLGPGSGVSGTASVELVDAIPNGFAALWVARSGAYEILPVLEDIGGLYPVLLRADATDFGRRFAPLPLTASGSAGFVFNQPAAIEGRVMFQWVVFDSNMDIVTTSTAVINQD
ncbi:MAG: hypothetical protein AAGB93_06200 [Planctomycetota bacterium]